MEKSVNETKKELNDRLYRCKKVVDGLENNEAFSMLIEDFKATAKRLDDNWQWITDDKFLKEAQITKMATLSIINSIDNYKHDIEKVSEQLDKIEHPEEIVGADFDNEMGVDNAEGTGIQVDG